MFGAAAALAAPSVITLPKTSPFPENITSTADGGLFVSSISNGGLLYIPAGTAQPQVWLKPGGDNTRSTFGVLADKRDGLLWVCSNDASAVGIAGPNKVKGAFLKAFDLKTRKETLSAQFPGSPAMCNDVAIGPDGSAYATNTMAPQILRLKPGAKTLTVWYTNPALKGGLDGIAFGPDGNLYVDTYNGNELFRIGVANGEPKGLTRLKTSRPLSHPDGLRPFRNGFLMAEGGEGTLDRVTLSGDSATITIIKHFAWPTGVTVVGDKAWVSEGQLDYLFDPKKKAQTPPPFHLRAVSLPGR